MEKYFTEDSSDSDNNEKDQKISKMKKIMILKAKIKSLGDQIEKERKKLNATRKAIKYIENKAPRFQPLPLECFVSPIESRTLNSKHLSKGAFENVPDSTTLTENLEQPFIDFYPHEEALAKQTDDISNKRESFEETEEAKFNILYNSSPKIPDNETQASGLYNKSDSPTDSEIIERNEESDRYYVGKGKEAANPAFRYKKRSKIVSFRDSPGKADNPIYRYEKSLKSNVSSSESLAKDSPVKRSGKVFGSPVSKTLDSQSQKAVLNRISPAIKRKVSDSNERDFDEICAKTLEICKLSGNYADEELKIAKKLKFEDEERISRQCTTALLTQTNYKGIDLAEFKDQSQIDQTSNEREQLILPSTSGLSNVVGYISNRRIRRS
ncbi:unnamed protein product [Larinioides sclopetarius]|uniref:Uncharacterized protein n=1 Tax=Larinioides sclopetarius TaxID=280406 RepID=A0AAV2B1S9_9ARAC